MSIQLLEAFYPATPNGEKYMNTVITMINTIIDKITSVLFQLARERSRSSLTVVAKVNPLICSGDGFSVSRLTTTKINMQNKKDQMQK
jgi:isocitrate/isopropylmalate dehydrogenase